MNKKDARIKRLWDKGVTDPKVIAQKLGYKGNALTSGIEDVKEALKRVGITLL